MNIVPQYISEDIESSAEARVFRAFQKVNIHSKSFLFHSIGYVVFGRIDLIYGSEVLP